MSREMTEQELWDFLDRTGVIEHDGEQWIYRQSKMRALIDDCDCLACQVRRGLWIIGFEDS